MRFRKTIGVAWVGSALMLCAASTYAYAAPANSMPTGEEGGIAAVPEIVALVPEAIKKRGVLRVATMTKYQPFSFVANGKTVGMIPEMVSAVAQTMGLKAEIQGMDFPAILLGLQAQKYDIGMGEFFVRKDRVEVADFVTEWSNFDAFVVNKGSKYMPESIADVCGHKIAILGGSSGVPAMETGKARCADEGKPAPQVSVFPQMADAVLALASKRVEAVLTGREVGLTLVASGQPFVPTGRVGGGPCATAVARNESSAGLLQALQAAYVHLIASGKYAQIHKRWGTDYGMITDPTIYKQGDALPAYTIE
ncbi:transporter substrate-binding domain-containing protein [Sodalis sp. C49]|uniref:transporter substrate-binding domain-containing protein n=1 Tax=unclassified Sodalis (in: enterobacteria) TaxID=2636512 RepID=UPI0039659729